jgi:hypothetical protein
MSLFFNERIMSLVWMQKRFFIPQMLECFMVHPGHEFELRPYPLLCPFETITAQDAEEARMAWATQWGLLGLMV